MSDPKPQSEELQEDAPPAGPAPRRSPEELLADAQAQLDEQREARLRALADADNARKRAQAEIAQARKFATERLIEELLPVIDSLDSALGASGDDGAALLSGVDVTRKQLLGVFERAGVVEATPEPGQRFDPHRQQAMAAVASDQEPNTVVAVLQKGYALHERIVRPALVTVAKAKTVENGAGNPISDSNLESN
jgi:molecular chaperone GrpE